MPRQPRFFVPNAIYHVYCRVARLVDIQATLRGFTTGKMGDATDYLAWIRSVAEAQWLNAGINDLPWWVEAKHTDEIADPNSHSATTFDRNPAPACSGHIGIIDFCRRFESISNHDLIDLKSHRRNPQFL